MTGRQQVWEGSGAGSTCRCDRKRGHTETHCGIVGEIPLNPQVIDHKTNRPSPYVIVQVTGSLGKA